MQAPETDEIVESPRRRPSRGWYVLALLILLVSASVFVYAVMDGRRQSWSRIEAMPRFAGPTSGAGVVVALDEPGNYVVYYENRGALDGRPFDTPRHQVWTTPTRPAMRCTVTPDAGETAGDGAMDSADTLLVRLLGQKGDASQYAAEFDQDRDVEVIYDRADRQGAGVWAVAIPEAGRYRIDISYVDAVFLDPESIEVPDVLTRKAQAEMTFAHATQYEADRLAAADRRILASLEPVDVLFAIGLDPTAQGYFQVVGLRGAASLLAFGFTASVLMALVTLMLRTGQVTQRGKLEDVRRGMSGR